MTIVYRLTLFCYFVVFFLIVTCGCSIALVLQCSHLISSMRTLTDVFLSTKQ